MPCWFSKKIASDYLYIYPPMHDLGGGGFSISLVHALLLCLFMYSTRCKVDWKLKIENNIVFFGGFCLEFCQFIPLWILKSEELRSNSNILYYLLLFCFTYSQNARKNMKIELDRNLKLTNFLIYHGIVIVSWARYYFRLTEYWLIGLYSYFFIMRLV